jgi:hypothetical protein
VEWLVIATLTELLDAVVAGRIELTDDMPTFGGHEPGCTVGVWSWDDTHLLVGDCVSELELVTRESDEKWPCLNTRCPQNLDT